MKISIITVCYNSASTIRETIESVLSQSYSNIEYIIIDGCSSDDTLSIIDTYQGRISKIISEPDEGIYDAMNKGIACSTGDFVGILNADDIFFDNIVIENLVSFVTKNPDADAIYSDLIYVDRNDTTIKKRTYSSKNFSFWKTRFGFMIPHPTFYVRRSFFDVAGFYKTGYRVAADFELMLRFMTKKIKFKRLPLITVKMREGGISNTGIWWIIHQNIEIVRACKENGIYSNIFFVSSKIPYKLASRFV